MAARSPKAATIRSGVTWLRPKERTPGVSITQRVRLRRGQSEGDGRAGGVPAPAGHRVDHPDRPIRARDQGVDQGRLADPGVPDEDAAVPVEALARSGVQIGARGGHLHRHAERLVLADQLIGRGEVGLCDVIASKVSATATMRATNAMRSRLNLSG